MKIDNNHIETIALDQLLLTTMEKKEQGYRLAQICCAFVNNQYEMSYSFGHGFQFVTYRIIIDKETEVPSITSIYGAAFLYENEMKELFGVNMEYIDLDYRNKLYRIDEETPFIGKEEK